MQIDIDVNLNLEIMVRHTLDLEQGRRSYPIRTGERNQAGSTLKTEAGYLCHQPLRYVLPGISEFRQGGRAITAQTSIRDASADKSPITRITGHPLIRLLQEKFIL